MDYTPPTTNPTVIEWSLEYNSLMGYDREFFTIMQEIENFNDE